MLGSQAAEEAVFQDDDSRALCAGDNSRHSLLGAQAFTKPYRGVIGQYSDFSQESSKNNAYKILLML